MCLLDLTKHRQRNPEIKVDLRIAYGEEPTIVHFTNPQYFKLNRVKTITTDLFKEFVERPSQLAQESGTVQPKPHILHELLTILSMLYQEAITEEGGLV